MNKLIYILISVALSITVYGGSRSTPLVSAAREQIGVTVLYDPAYRTIAYPGGDVPSDRGVCTDVIIRALRVAFGFDLQTKVHTDMKANFSSYPKNWSLRKPDPNIDHRRVPNLQKFFERLGCSIAISDQLKDYQPGDIVTCLVSQKLPHIMIVSDKTSISGRPLVIHNIGNGTQEDDCLFMYKITGHYRVLPAHTK